jgi:hypothetical protein
MPHLLELRLPETVVTLGNFEVIITFAEATRLTLLLLGCSPGSGCLPPPALFSRQAVGPLYPTESECNNCNDT